MESKKEDLIDLGNIDYIIKKAFEEALLNYQIKINEEYYSLTFEGEAPKLTGFF